MLTSRILSKYQLHRVPGEGPQHHRQGLDPPRSVKRQIYVYKLKKLDIKIKDDGREK